MQVYSNGRKDALHATLFKKQKASRPNTPSTDTTNGVKEAHLNSAAAEYFIFFSYSVVDKIALTGLFV